MVKVQRVMLAPSEPTWVVLDDDYQLIAPIQDYFDYLRSLDRSPNTIRTRADGFVIMHLIQLTFGI